MKSVLFSTAILVLASGCASLSTVPADPAGVNTPVFAPLTSGEVVIVEVISVNGASAPSTAFEKSMEDYRQLIAGELKVIDGEPVTLDLGEDESLSMEQVEGILEGAAHQGAASIVLVIAPDFDFFTFNRGMYMGPSLGHPDSTETHLVMLSTRRIQKIPRIPIIFFGDDIWRYIITHELCHSLGIPSSATHRCDKGHCTRTSCVLFSPQHAFLFVSRLVLTLGPPNKPCKICLDEIVASQAVVNNRLLKGGDPIGDIDWDRRVLSNSTG